jgi:uncharacterized protein YndB with AHSA1/START domain
VVRIELTIDVARPAYEVFEHLTDLDRIPEWQASAVESRADEPLGRRRAHLRVPARARERDPQRARGDGVRPAAPVDVEGAEGPVRFTVDHLLAETDGSTRLQVVRGGKAGRLHEARRAGARAQAEHELRGDFARLKELLEG